MSQNNERLLKTKSDDSSSHLQFFSIANQLKYGLVLFVVLSLLLTGGILIYFSFQSQVDQLILVQQERSRSAASQITAYMDDLQRKLGYLARVRGLTDLSSEVQQDLLEALIRHNTAYETAAILNQNGQVMALASLDDDPILPDNLPDSPLFVTAFNRQEDFMGQVTTDPDSHLPFIYMAVPIRDRQEEVAGVLMTRVDLNFLWFIVSQVDVGETGYAYIIDNRNFLIAEKGNVPETFELVDISNRPFLENLMSSTVADLTTYTGLEGAEVLGAISPVQNTGWSVVVELPTAEAFRPIQNLLIVTGVALAIAVVLALSAGVLMTRQILDPLQQLIGAAEQIGAGNMEVNVELKARNEMRPLAAAFNTMTAQIRYLVKGLEDRTDRLEAVASLNEQLSAILNFDQLLNELVQKVKQQFAYRQVQVYLFDNNRQNLALISQADDEIGEQVIQPDSQNMATDIVTRAAQSGEVVFGGQLPYSEIAVPIILGSERDVLGVLNVQQAEEIGLDEGDASLLRSLANQVATAIRNAQLFDEVETSLRQAQELQERYITQSWEKTKLSQSGSSPKQYSRNEATPLADYVIEQVGQQAQHLEKPTVLAPEKQGESDIQSGKVLVAPVSLGAVNVGNLQLHVNDVDYTWKDNELLLIEAIVDQVAQSAENLRLFDQVQERASREQLIGQISDKLRRAPNMEALLETGVSELARVLGTGRTYVRFGSTDELQKATLQSGPAEAQPTNGDDKPDPDRNRQD